MSKLTEWFARFRINSPERLSRYLKLKDLDSVGLSVSCHSYGGLAPTYIDYYLGIKVGENVIEKRIHSSSIYIYQDHEGVSKANEEALKIAQHWSSVLANDDIKVSLDSQLM